MVFFKPTSSERRGMIVLMIALLIIIGVGVISFFSSDDEQVDARDALVGGFNGQGRIGNRQNQKYYAVKERKVETFDFDPNEADSTTLLRLGFAPYQVRGIYKYRAMGGRYMEPDDVRRVPGMTYELWDRISPHIRIGHKYQRVAIIPRKYEGHAASADTSDSVPRIESSRFSTKLREGQFVSLNHSDTTELKRIPGIGSYFARQIVRYREQLGGYVSVNQLQEIDGMPEGVERWLKLDTVGLRRIDVNHASRNQLIRHPYLRFERSRAIIDRLHNFGPLRSIDELRSLPNFTEEDIIRLTPYLEFK